MKIKHILILMAAAFLLVTCKQYKDLSSGSLRQVQPAGVASYHPPIMLNIGWLPYQDQKLVKTGKNEWKVVQGNEGRQGAVPVILVTYQGSTDSIWIDMNMDNALLGKLIKHSLMTQEPIKRPFAEYFDAATCSRCHPADVKINQ